MLLVEEKVGGYRMLMSNKEYKSAFEEVILALDTYREVFNKSGDKFDVWKEDARRNLDRLLLRYFGFSESETIRRQRELLQDVGVFIINKDEYLRIDLEERIKIELGVK